MGYQSGFYKNTKKTDNCLNDKVISDVMDIVDFCQTFDNTKIFAIFNEGMEIFNSVQSCSIAASIDDVTTYCGTHPNSCTSAAVMDNVTKNMFVLMGKFTEITSIVQGFPAHTATDLYT